ncbi:MAG: rsfS [Firmicutes bacterium]|nr:rsfS [Bacillota bacterium]
MTEQTIQLPELIMAAASEKKARDIVALDMRAVSPVTDYFIICSGNSTTQVQAIVDNIEEKLEEQGIFPLHKEGYRGAHWVLLDYGSCVAHVFVEEDRSFYNLESLWSDAPARKYEA